ncbi:MAG: lamin tail domain-containing protein, partial [Flavobacteriales bacterium]
MRINLCMVIMMLSTGLVAQNINLRVNEIMASNRAGQFDEFLEYDDWVEIYNPPGNPITNLAGYYISDNPDSLTKWMIPATDPGLTTILPNGFLALWIDNDFDNLTSQGANHNAGFSLSAEGEFFMIVAPDGLTIIDSVSYPVVADDISYGRVCDGCDAWQYFNNVTFESTNIEIQPNHILFVNEVQPINNSTYDDPQHEFDAWFEIFNPNPFQVNLANYYLSTTANPLAWRVPVSNPVRTVIPALSYLLIWCDYDTTDDVNHAPLTMPL